MTKPPAAALLSNSVRARVIARMLTLLVIVVVSAALVGGAAWGAYGNLSPKLEGFIIALAGGALMVSAVLELVDPATKVAPLWAVVACVLTGAIAFTLLDKFVKRKFGSDSGGGLLAAITLDGIPENLALGVALIGVGPLQVASLSGSIFLSNLPEAAGGAQEMVKKPLEAQGPGLWAATALLLSIAALARLPSPGRGPESRARTDPLRRRRRRHRLPRHRSLPQGIQGGQLRHRDRHGARTGARRRAEPAGLKLCSSAPLFSSSIVTSSASS